MTKSFSVYIVTSHKQNNRDKTSKRGRVHETLREILLEQTILFNRRRAGDVSKITTEEYTNAHKANIDGRIKDSLTELEKKLCNTFFRGSKQSETEDEQFRFCLELKLQSTWIH
ncbi:hypothetical protein CHS0354_041762 [Potamilus streckersoni]|uniref:Uncharacterized protein n=1 Tax=Potamilus streckersoni TaxID=2493646 RepID=A0AAE0T1F8_9BIVA|nr:hypothetical protein CHS0354_041762 [Potamilus streckersoni]